MLQVCIGELGPGSCIGELFFRGEETQPYTTVSTTRVRVGWVTGTVIRGEYTVQENMRPYIQLLTPVG